MRVLALDVSTKSGWALFEDGKLADSGSLEQISVEDFNVNSDPELSPLYPHNVVDAAEKIGRRLAFLTNEHHPNVVVIENTNRGKNRHTQRLLEWLHLELVKRVRNIAPFFYMDSSEWRSCVGLRLSKEDKKNNKDVKAGKKRGKIGLKHLAVRMVNELYGKSLILKDNDEADAILLGRAFHLKYAKGQK
jgi:hypothetical protein